LHYIQKHTHIHRFTGKYFFEKKKLNFDISGTPSWRLTITTTTKKKGKSNYQQHEEEKENICMEEIK